MMPPMWPRNQQMAGRCIYLWLGVLQRDVLWYVLHGIRGAYVDVSSFTLLIYTEAIILVEAVHLQNTC